MNSIRTKIIAGTIVLGALLAPIAANAATCNNGHSVNGRFHNQQRRIANGVRTGALTPGETYRLESREARLRGQESFDRRHDDGRLTGFERRRLEREQNRDSAAIYRDKHNDRRF